MAEQPAVVVDDVHDDVDLAAVRGGEIPGARWRWLLMVGGLLLIVALAVALQTLTARAQDARLDEVAGALELPTAFSSAAPSVDVGRPTADGAWCLPEALRCWVVDQLPVDAVDMLAVALTDAGATDVAAECSASPAAPDGDPVACHATGAVGRGEVTLAASSDLVPGEEAAERGATTVMLLPSTAVLP